jgi:hypothetical protein
MDMADGLRFLQTRPEQPESYEVRPTGKAPPKERRLTMAVILWRHQNVAKWLSSPAEPSQ